jgi:phosphoribosyl-ATP pyrophosphohydrolase
MDNKDKEKIIGEAQDVLNLAITHLKGSIKCKVTDYKRRSYTAQLFNKEDRLIMPVQIPVEWIEGSKPTENVVDDRLKMLLRNLERYVL